MHSFFNDVDRIGDPEYVPTVQDLLLCRITTTGISDMLVPMPNSDRTIQFVDVGGQRSERRKWIHCFEDVTCILFFASLSEYDQKLLEENSVPRILESLKLFKDIANSKYLRNTPVILFLNKVDLFEKKIQRVPLNVMFPTYNGKLLEWSGVGSGIKFILIFFFFFYWLLQ